MLNISLLFNFSQRDKIFMSINKHDIFYFEKLTVWAEITHRCLLSMFSTLAKKHVQEKSCVGQ